MGRRKADKNPEAFQPSHRVRRLRVHADAPDGCGYAGTRDVYLESRGEIPEWRVELFDLYIPCVNPTGRSVVDVVRFFQSQGVEVVYEPPGNMAEYFYRKRRPDEQSLFT